MKKHVAFATTLIAALAVGVPAQAATNPEKWHSVPMPLLMPRVWLSESSAGSPTDVWVTGSKAMFLGITPGKPFALHYNGSKFTEVALPSSAAKDSVSSIADDPDGEVFLAQGDAYYQYTGSSWTRIDGPEPGSATTGAFFGGAAGDWYLGDHLYHWNGSGWDQQAAPAGLTLGRPHAVGANDVWSVSPNPSQLAHWDGTSWTQVAIPDLGTDWLRDVAATPDGDLWITSGPNWGYNPGTLWHRVDGVWSQVTLPDGASLDAPIAEDSAGNFFAAALKGPDAGQYAPGYLTLRYHDGAWTQAAANYFGGIYRFAYIPGTDALWGFSTNLAMSTAISTDG